MCFMRFKIPGVPAHVVNVSGRLPAEKLLCPRRICPVGGNIAFAARGHFKGDLFSARAFEGSDDFQHTVAPSASEIDRSPPGVRHHERNRFGMTVCKIHDMDVVANAGAVGRGIVAAEDAELREDAVGDTGDIGEQIIGDTVRILSDETGRMCADRVEVAQADCAEVGVGAADVRENFFNVQFRAAVGIGLLCRSDSLPSAGVSPASRRPSRRN